MADKPGADHWVPHDADIEQLRSAVPQCRGCELWEPATQPVLSAGRTDAPLVLVGEQPGDQEDRRGVPFVGPAGHLLQRAVEEAGIDRGSVYVTNAVKHFRFTERSTARGGVRRLHQTPDTAHVLACRPWLVAELRAVAPTVVVALGATAVRSLLGPDVKVMRDRGRPIERETSRGTTTFVVTAHPSAVLRVPEDVREQAYGQLVADLRLAGSLIGA